LNPTASRTPHELQQQLHWLVSGSVGLLDAQQQPVVTMYPEELFGLLADGLAGIEDSLARTDCTLVSIDHALVKTLQAVGKWAKTTRPSSRRGPRCQSRSRRCNTPPSTRRRPKRCRSPNVPEQPASRQDTPPQTTGK
jgi:hypothetical protein